MPVKLRQQLRVTPACRVNIPTNRVNLNVNHVIKVIKRKVQAKNSVPNVMLGHSPMKKGRNNVQSASQIHDSMKKVKHFARVVHRGDSLVKVLRQRYVHLQHQKPSHCHRV
jgi:hypothetical protein